MKAGACTACGTTLQPGVRFCTKCGEPVPDAPTLAAPARPVAGATWPAAAPPEPATMALPPEVPPPAPVTQTSGAAAASLVLGVLTWLLSAAIVGFATGYLTAPLAIGLGMAGRRRVAADPGRWKGNGMATAGLTLGMVWMVLATVFVSLLVLARLNA